jgi:hypothetical protein
MSHLLATAGKGNLGLGNRVERMQHVVYLCTQSGRVGKALHACTIFEFMFFYYFYVMGGGGILWGGGVVCCTRGGEGMGCA